MNKHISYQYLYTLGAIKECHESITSTDDFDLMMRTIYERIRGPLVFPAMFDNLLGPNIRLL